MKSIKPLYIIISLFLIIAVDAFSQRIIRKTEAIRSNLPIKINGIIDEEIWKSCPVAGDFYQYQPLNGTSSKYKTEVRICYDNSAIYVAARMYDPFPDSIPRELGVRDDQNLNADYFNISLNPFNDGTHEFIFVISSSGIQVDTKCTVTDYDDSWDAVWQSAVSIDSLGWIAELKIPLSAIRYPKTLGNTWGLNFWRAHQRSQEVSCWNKVDNSSSQNTNQAGELYGIAGIVPPLRLSVIPYISTYLEHFPYSDNFKDNTNWTLNGGMDIKFGLNESFTLDMTLIPDFGQVQSDNIILNLSPFEIKYEDKRPFFTEGTELFSKADLFYSRRIGSTPVDYYSVYDNLGDGDSVIKNPSETQLLNASKLSGRTSKGLGVGFFNAITSNTYAKIQDKYGNVTNKLTQALSNYNIIVLDQVIKKNSNISLINTNAYYDKGGRMANVTGTEFKFSDKQNIFALLGNSALSQKFDSINTNPTTGFKYDVSFGKISGRFKFALTQKVLSEKFDISDLGYFEYNNSLQNVGAISYNFYKPFWKLMSLYNDLQITQSYQFKPQHYANLEMILTSEATLRDFSTLTIMGDLIPFKNYDFFEPRIPGRYLVRDASWWIYLIYASDMRKKISWDLNAGYLNSKGGFKDSFWWLIGPKFRVSNRFSINYALSIDHEWHDIGFAAFDTSASPQILIGKRDVRRIENNLGINYIFSKNTSVKLLARHYWSTVDYLDYYLLKQNGELNPTVYNEDINNSFNAFNIDLMFSWRFAPGSEMNIVWKNQILSSEKVIPISYSENWNNTFKSDQLNSLSVKLLYYLDYQYLRKKKSTI